LRQSDDAWLKGSPADLSRKIHKQFGLLALYAPDEVYRRLKETFYNKTVYAKDVRPPVYHALRKSLFKTQTQLEPTDFVDNLQIQPLPENKAVGGGAV
jgi:hypothetical protein